MRKKLDLSRYTVRELIQRVQSRQVSPGCGAAAAVALALAAACAGKAIAVTLKHRTAPALRRARSPLRELGRRALAGAERDAESFATFLKLRDRASARHLLRTGESLASTARRLRRLIRTLEPHICRQVSADVAAARALCTAALAIERINLQENRAAMPARAKRRSRRSRRAPDR